MTERHPACTSPPEDCRIRSLWTSTTLLAWTPEYDGNGKLLNKNPNTITTTYECATCGRHWTVRT